MPLRDKNIKLTICKSILNLHNLFFLYVSCIFGWGFGQQDIGLQGMGQQDMGQQVIAQQDIGHQDLYVVRKNATGAREVKIHPPKPSDGTSVYTVP